MQVAVDAHEAIDLRSAHARRRRRREGARDRPKASCAPARRRPGTTCTGNPGCVFVTVDRRGHQRDRRRHRVRRDRSVDRRPGTTTPRAARYIQSSRMPGARRSRSASDHVNLIKFRDASVVPAGDRVTIRRAATPRQRRGHHDRDVRRRFDELARRRDRRCGHRAQRRRLRDRGQRPDARHARAVSRSCRTR